MLEETDDNDSDVDYDPRQALRKKRSAPTNNSAQERPAKRQKGNGSSSRRDTLLITLKLPSATGRALLSRIASPIKRSLNSDDNHSSTDSQPYLPTTFSSERYTLRSRDNIPRNAQSGSELRSTRSLLSLDPDHPAARGCKNCWEFNQECSLLDRPLFYPWQVCREDQVDCDLIIPPGQKRGCENCRRKGLVCSYDKQQEDHHLPVSNLRRPNCNVLLDRSLIHHLWMHQTKNHHLRPFPPFPYCRNLRSHLYLRRIRSIHCIRSRHLQICPVSKGFSQLVIFLRHRVIASKRAERG